jgi:transposase InsO family protein
MTEIWAGSAVGWAYLVCVIDCCTREIVGRNLSHRCRTALLLKGLIGSHTAEQRASSRADELSGTGTQVTRHSLLVESSPAHRTVEGERVYTLWV